MIHKAIGQLQRQIWNKKRRNSGSAIVIVIIAMAMIGILATTLLWMSYINYMIKVNDIRNKKSFYSAETVMEQIMAGLQNTVSVSVTEAYDEVLSNWDSLGTEGNRYSAFSTAYLDTLVKLLKDPSKGDGYYQRDLLKGYVDPAVWSQVNETAWMNGTDSTDASEVKAATMEIVNGNSLMLRNVFVSYQEGDRLSIISTDICLDVPQVVFTRTGSVENLYEYLLIGNQGIEVTGGSGNITADGNLFAGVDAGNPEKGGLTVNYASTLTVDNASLVVSKGDIDVVGPGAAFVVHDAAESGSKVYARSIDLQSGTVSLDARTYVANDLTLSGNGSKATLTKEYYGYGASIGMGTEENPSDQANSSAIIINGQNSTVDMSGVNTMMLAGRAYIGTTTKKSQLDENAVAIADGTLGKNNKAVLMGESIAVKGGQIAYLVPTECLGVYKGTTVIGQNPVSQKQSGEIEAYLTKYGTDFLEVDFTRKVNRLGGKSLAEFGVTDMTHIRKVHTQYVGGGEESKSLTYYYVVLDKERAAAYFAEYYANEMNKQSVDRYFKKYASGGILLGNYGADNTSYTILGNALVSDVLSESGVQLLSADPLAEPKLHDMTDAQVLAQSEEIGKTYLALTTNLTEDAASVSPTQNVFNSVISENIKTIEADGTETVETIEAYLAKNGGEMEFETDGGLKGIVTSNNVTLSSMANTSDVRLIVSLGDITIDRNFTGLAIAKGQIKVTGGVSNGASSLKREKMELYKVLNATTGAEGSTVTPLNFFVNGTSGISGSNAQEVKTDELGNLVIDYNAIVRYVNWIKK